MKKTVLFLIATFFLGGSIAYSQTATSTPSRQVVPDALQKAATRVPTEYELSQIIIDYKHKIIRVEVLVYDQYGAYLSNTTIDIGGDEFASVVTPELLNKISGLAMVNVGK